jgi:plasmid stabilization system protein ParE
VKRSVRWSRAALDDLKQQVRHIAKDDPAAARSLAERIDAAAALLGERAVGRPGRVGGTYEKSVNGLPYVIAYRMEMAEGRETLFILRIIHTARQWPREEWPD